MISQASHTADSQQVQLVSSCTPSTTLKSPDRHPTVACLCAQASPGYRVLLAMLSLAGTYAIQMVGGKLLWVSEWAC